MAVQLAASPKNRQSERVPRLTVETLPWRMHLSGTAIGAAAPARHRTGYRSAAKPQGGPDIRRIPVGNHPMFEDLEGLPVETRLAAYWSRVG
ncbi:hypothetical protein [Thauera sinica]|uniref:Uncharacterized protein n=1 Tax=Thauera sinica TaxID=2665146 RepID=A0ABW1AT23_9RHOO|nr:hypothetical protein [Thauera sp. K11]